MGGGKRPDTSSIDALEEISTQLFQQTDPLRREFITQSLGFLGLEPQEVTRTIPGETRTVRGIGRGEDALRTITTPEQTITETVFERTGQQFDPSRSPLFDPAINAINEQSNVARENILATLPAGGALQEGLADVDIARGRDVAGVSGRIAEEELNRAFSLATGAPLQTSVGGLTSAAGTQGALAAQQAAQLASAKGGIGQGVGFQVGRKAVTGGA